MGLSRGEQFIVTIVVSLFSSFFAFLLQLDPAYYFFLSVAIAYLNFEIQGRLWNWYRKSPPFKGFRFWYRFWRDRLKL